MFAIYPIKCINDLKTWISSAILAEIPNGNLVSINGFTKSGKSTLSQAVLPSLMKMSLEANPVKFGISYIQIEVPKSKNNWFAIAEAFLSEMSSKFRAVGFIIAPFPKCLVIDQAISNIKRIFHEFHTFVIKHKIRVLFVVFVLSVCCSLGLSLLCTTLKSI